jgi:uncharacterized protein (DUF1697 family)
VTRSLALLRGVNVGGRRALPMTDLTQWLLDAGFTSVSTYIQSGNVVLEHRARLDVGARVRAVIAEHTGWDVPVVVRSAVQLAEVVAANPYPQAEPTTLHVAFLESAPDVGPLADLDPQRWLPEEFTAHGREVYLHLPQGMGRSVMAPRLAILKNATTRNWNTVLALAARLGD